MKPQGHVAKLREFLNEQQASGVAPEEIPVWRVEEIIIAAWSDGHREGVKDVQDILREEQTQRRLSK
jgi:hypothetical protein